MSEDRLDAARTPRATGAGGSSVIGGEDLARAVPDAAALARYAGRRTVIKLGGSVGPGETVLQEVAWLQALGARPLLVHGGGPLITAWLQRVGKETHFVDGLRHTDPETLDVARMVLVGLVNTELVAQLGALGAPAWGLCGADGRLLRAVVRDERLGLVGEVEQVEVGVLDLLTEAGYLPVVAPIAVGAAGQCLNVNADTVAGAVAAAVGAGELVFLTDVPGIQDTAGVRLARLTGDECARLVAAGVIHGGMLPKVEACRRAAAAGATSRIVDGRPAYALLTDLAAAASSGTTIVA
jgi:acetylglutamate kinase